MPLVRVAAVDEIPPGTMFEHLYGDDRVVIANVDGALHAIDGTCPHRQGPLAQGALHGVMVVCPWHAWEFDCTTGECDFNPLIRQQRFRVFTDGDSVMLELPE